MNALSLGVSLLVVCTIHAQTNAPAPTPAPKTSNPVGTWILQIEGNAHALQVVGVSHKGSAFRAPRRLTSPYRLQLFDANGKQLTSVPIDLTDFCLDPAHVGKQDHVRGSQIIQHKVCMNFKVPALAGVAEIRITKLIGTTPTVYGRIDRQTILSLAAASKEVR